MRRGACAPHSDGEERRHVRSGIGLGLSSLGLRTVGVSMVTHLPSMASPVPAHQQSSAVCPTSRLSTTPAPQPCHGSKSPVVVPHTPCAIPLDVRSLIEVLFSTTWTSTAGAGVPLQHQVRHRPGELHLRAHVQVPGRCDVRRRVRSGRL